MSIFLVVKGGKIKLEPDTSWAWQGFDGEILLNGGQSLLNVKGKPVVIETDFPQNQMLGQTYKTLIPPSQAPGIIQSIELSVDESTLSTHVFSKEAGVTKKTKGNFKATIASPATVNNAHDKDFPTTKKEGKWEVIESGQKIMAVEATAPQSLFLKMKETQISAPANNQNKVIEESTTIAENQPEKVHKYNFTYQHEIGLNSTKPHLPPGKNSGVTIGPGYDLGQRTTEQIKQELQKSDIDKDVINKLSTAAGFKGNNARQWIESNKNLNIQINQKQQKKLFEKILVPIYENGVQQYMNKFFDKNTWNNLDSEQKNMLFDMHYNVGLSKFPKFTKAVVNKDWATAKKEYKRKGVGNRNNDFYKSFLRLK
jgi:hypothetical protein